MSEGGWCELLSCTLLSVECVLYNRGGVECYVALTHPVFLGTPLALLGGALLHKRGSVFGKRD